MPKPPRERLRFRVRGAVQGVGFRPFAYRLASRLALAGFVRNDAEGVLIEVEGAHASAFLSELETAAPPLARIDSIEVAAIAPVGGEGFIIEATRQGKSTTRIGADAAVCEDCLDELFDPTSRFFGYPLINCTHCGPRYTLTRALPYDRAQTSMAPFPMCGDCARDYADPSNRRFHAEPIACPRCGPKLNVPIPDVVEVLLAQAILMLVRQINERRAEAAAACEFLGLDPLNVANEGELVAIVAPEYLDALIAAMKAHPLGLNSAVIGRAVDDPNRFVEMRTAFGGGRIVDWLAGEQLPRIC